MLNEKSSLNAAARLVVPRSGFALVTTLVLMALLALMAVGMLSLSSVALRGSAVGASQQQARANARLALMMAIGELQARGGVDTRITAPADLLDPGNPPLLGVWRSWEGSDHDATGRPVAPDYSAKNRPASGGGNFLGWLVSSSSGASQPGEAAELVFTTPQTGTVPLLSDGSLAPSDPREVHVVPSVVGSDGRIAWWVSGENQKARLTRPRDGQGNLNESAQMIQSHPVPDPGGFGLDAVLTEPELVGKLVSRPSLEMVESTADQASGNFHDLSVVSKGLLTNSATGGWRKDLSLLTANWDRLARVDLPLFRLTPDGQHSAANRASNGNPTPDQGALYPWSEYRPFNGSVFSQQAAAASWTHLADWMTRYQAMTVDANGGLTLPVTPPADIRVQSNAFHNLHRQRIYPLIARIQFVFYHYSSSDQIPHMQSLPEDRYRLHLRVVPVVTFWNPYNFRISVNNRIYFRTAGPIPLAIQYSFNSARSARFAGVMEPQNGAARSETGFDYDLNFERYGATYTQMVFEITPPVDLGPGESRVFSPTASIGNSMKGPNVVIAELTPGVRDQACYGMRVLQDGQSLQDWHAEGLPGATRIGTSVRFDNTLMQEGVIGSGVHLDVFAGENLSRVWQLGDLDEVRYQMRGVYDRAIAAEVMPPIDERAMQSVSLAEIHNNPTPFLSMIFGLRTANNGLLASKGLVQSSPFANSSRMGIDNVVGGGHPINSSYDFSYAVHPPGGDSLLPEISNDGSGFIVSGINSADGLTRCKIAEIPSRPVASLVELTNWDLRFENPHPPYGFNLIGNSDASPLIPSDAVHSGGVGVGQNLQHDDSYCANHLLFDDWFVSAIAPTTATSPGGARTVEQVFKEHLSGERALPTQAYQPIVEDRTSSTADPAGELAYDREVAPVDSWKTIASRLEVEGMFNVNSTSVRAWRALLRHARGQQIPYLDAGDQPTLSAETDHALSRFTVAGDAEAGTFTGLSGVFPEASEFTGFRVFSQAMLDRLAEEIVEQVRIRGPFLSLSEFVNRQLFSGEPALAGAVQTALNRLQQSADNPYAVLQALSDPTVADPTRADEGYLFDAAAVGFSTHGVPGWTRQADVLRPLAPILSVRDDTFTIRAYGDSLDESGNVISRAYCEAVVQRTRNHVDPADEADRFDALQSQDNRRFGRKFEILSFKWLSPEEV